MQGGHCPPIIMMQEEEEKGFVSCTMRVVLGARLGLAVSAIQETYCSAISIKAATELTTPQSPPLQGGD